MSEYERGGQLQDYLERFQGSEAEAGSLAQLAFDLSCQVKWMRYKVSATSDETTMESKSAVVKAYYSAKPLPLIPWSTLENAHDTISREDASGFMNPVQADNTKTGKPRSVVINTPSIHFQKMSIDPAQQRNSYKDEKSFLNNENDLVKSSESYTSTYATSTTPNYISSRTHTAKVKIEEIMSEAFTITDLSYKRLEAHVVNTVLQDVVANVMQEFNTRWSQEMQQEPGPTNSRGSETNEGRKPANLKEGKPSSISHSPSSHTTSTSKRKRSLCDGPSDDDRADDEQPQPPPKVMEMGKSSLGIKLACPFRKNNPAKYSLATHRVCAASGWGSIHRLKSVPVPFFEYPVKITLNCELYELTIRQRTFKSLP
jgi:hypothetical protein